MNKKVTAILLFLSISIGFTSCENSSKEVVITKAKYKGEKDMAWAIAHYIEYPTEEMKFNRAGVVKITFKVDEKGKVNEIKATLDEEIKAAEIAVGRKKVEGEVLSINLPVLESLIKSVEKLNFHPATNKGKPIRSTVTTSVEFILI